MTDAQSDFLFLVCLHLFTFSSHKSFSTSSTQFNQSSSFISVTPYSFLVSVFYDSTYMSSPPQLLLLTIHTPPGELYNSESSLLCYILTYLFGPTYSWPFSFQTFEMCVLKKIRRHVSYQQKTNCRNVLLKETRPKIPLLAVHCCLFIHPLLSNAVYHWPIKTKQFSYCCRNRPHRKHGCPLLLSFPSNNLETDHKENASRGVYRCCT
jgi:hypothetical protein